MQFLGQRTARSLLAELAHLQLSGHARRMIRAAWTLGARSTKIRRYSTTFGVLCDARAEYRRAQTGPYTEETTRVLAHWTFAGTGLTLAERWLAASLEPAPGTEGEPIHG